MRPQQQSLVLGCFALLSSLQAAPWGSISQCTCSSGHSLLKMLAQPARPTTLGIRRA